MKLDRLTAVVALSALALTAAVTFGDAPAPAPSRPGVLGGGVTLLPNGWKIAPAGRHIQIGDLPLAMIESPDGGSLLVATNGYAKPTITVVDLVHGYVSSDVPLDHAWLGLAWHPDGKRFYVSGAGNNTVHEMHYEGGKVTRGVDLVLGRPMDKPAWAPNRPEPVPQSFIGGVAVSPDGTRLYAVHVLGQAVSEVDLKSGRVLRTIDLPAEPYTCAVSPDGTTLFVSLWGGAKVLLFDARTLEAKGEVAVGEHPNAMAITKDGTRLFVACANTNAVWAVDVDGRRAIEQIRISLFPDAPPGSTPNHVSLSPDETRLLVANADNNTVAVVDVSKPGSSTVDGFIPTGWYPTAAMFSRDAKNIFILSGKGLTSVPNPRMKRRELVGGDAQYIGGLLTGTLSILPVPPPATLQALTKTVYAVTPYADRYRLTPAGAPAASPIPKRVGDPSPIKHVFYVIRENRSYDQVLGDLRRGNGDPTLTLFGEDVTPNAHALAREFVAFDNFYVDAEVSYDGHAFSTAATPATSSRSSGRPTTPAAVRRTSSEGGGAMRNAYGNVARAGERLHLGRRARGRGRASAATASSSYPNKAHQNVAQVPGLQGKIDADYPPFNLDIPDQTRADAWLKEFARARAEGRGAGALDHPPRQRPHGRDAARVADAARDGRRQRPRARPDRRGDLRRARSGRSRRSSSSRTTRRTVPTTWTRIARCVLVVSPFSRRHARRQHALHDVGRAAHDGAHPGPAADEPVRRGGDADVQRVPGDADVSRHSRTSTRACPARREEHAERIRRGRLAGDEPGRGRHGPRTRDERDHLALGPRGRFADACDCAQRVGPSPGGPRGRRRRPVECARARGENLRARLANVTSLLRPRGILPAMTPIPQEWTMTSYNRRRDLDRIRIEYSRCRICA